MTDYKIEPLTDFTIFTTPESERLPNRFRAGWNDTLKLLGDEVARIGGGTITLELGCSALDLRRDGMLRAHAKVTHPGVRISFDSDLGPLSYATDAFAGRWHHDPPDWQINVRAIALGLQKLRQVDDYGIAKRGEQYAGFKALPAGRAMPASHMTSDAARALIAGILGWSELPSDPDRLAAAVKKAQRLTHPDHNDGDHSRWHQVAEAAQVLGAAR